MTQCSPIQTTGAVINSIVFKMFGTSSQGTSLRGRRGFGVPNMLKHEAQDRLVATLLLNDKRQNPQSPHGKDI